MSLFGITRRQLFALAAAVHKPIGHRKGEVAHTSPMGILFSDPRVRPFCAAGFGQTGCYLYFYETGTTTRANVFADGSLTKPLTQPVMSDSSGRFIPIYLSPGVTYRVQMYDGAGSLLEDTDPYVVPGALGVTRDSVGALLYPQTAQEINAGVAPSNGIWPPGYPERYIAGEVAYTTTAGITGTDFSAAINTALGISGQPCILGPNLYRAAANNLIMPQAQKLIGQGLNLTGIVLDPTQYSGIAINWNSSFASKIEMRGFTLYCNSGPGSGCTAVTGGIVLGNGPNPYGTEGFIDQIMVRDLPAGVKAFDIYGNIGELGNIYALNSGGIRIIGSGNSIYAMENTAASGFIDVNGNMTATELQDGWVGLFECEAPNTGILLLTVNGQLTVDYFVPALAASTAFHALVYLTSNCAAWEINIPQIYFGGGIGTYATFNDLFYDQAAGTHFGAGSRSAFAASRIGCGRYSSGLMTQGTQFAVKKQQLNNFSVLVANRSGVVQHKITAPGQSSIAGSWTSSIAGASATFTVTPTGNDASTGFASGAKISSADAHLFVLDSGAEIAADAVLSASVTLNNTGIGYLVRPTLVSLDINGRTQNRLAFHLMHGSSGSNAAWTAALAAAGNELEITFLGFVK